MSSMLKTSIKLESSTLYPNNVLQTQVYNLHINGTFAGFNKMIVETTPVKLNNSDIDGASLSAYLYISAPSTNLQTVFIKQVGATESFARLAPGEFAFLSYGGQTTTPDIVAYTVGAGHAEIHYFIGEKD